MTNVNFSAGQRRAVSYLTAAMLMLYESIAFAQVSPSAPPEPSTAPPAGLEEVVVTGLKLEENLPGILEQQGTRVDTISAQQIANGGYVDMTQTLQSLAPGLFISPKNGPFDYVDVSLQGSRTTDLLWLVDGVRINNRLYAGTTPLDTLPSAMVERIEILEGGQALFYGTEAAAGAVNIVTKAFSNTPDGAVSLGGDTNDSGHFDGYFRDTLGRSHFVLYADADLSSGFQPFRTQDYQPSSTDHHRAYAVYTFGGKYAYDVTDDLRLSVLYQYDWAKLDYAQPQLVQQAWNDRNEQILSGKIDYTPSDNFQLFAKGYYHDWASHYTEYDNVVGSPGQLATVENHGPWGYTDYGLNVLSRFQFGSALDTVVGYDFQRYSGSDAVLVIRQSTESVNAVFGQIATPPDLIDNAKFALGVRYNAPSFGQSATLGTLSGKYDMTSDLFVRGQGGTAFRLPTAEELFANDPDDERGDPNLKPEKSTNINLSVGGYADAHHLKWEVIGFIRNISNLISYGGFDAATDQALFANIPGIVHVRGGELDLTAEFTDYTANFNYTYSHSVQAGGQQIDRVPMQQSKASFDYHPENLPFGVTATVVYVGNEYQSGLWDGREQYGNYAVFDLAGRVFLDDDRRQIISVRLENVFGQQYASSLGTAERDSDGSNYTYWNLGAPRTFSARYTYKF